MAGPGSLRWATSPTGGWVERQYGPVRFSPRHACYNERPAETWATPGRPPIADPYDHPLTLGAVLAAHDTLVTHASCGPAISGYGSDGEDFDGASCPCQWHDALIEELANSRLMVQSWPGFICGACWAASCECRYVLDTPTHASGRDRNHRFTCHASACLLRRDPHLA